MAGDARQRINMERCLGQPFGVACNRFRIFMASGALDVDVATGYSQKRLYRMRVVAISAAGIFAMQALVILGKDGCVTLLAGCP
jgi:hypothetical protein